MSRKRLIGIGLVCYNIALQSKSGSSGSGVTTLNSTPTTVEHKRKSSLFRKTNKVSQDAKTVASKDVTQVTFKAAILNCADPGNDTFLVCYKSLQAKRCAQQGGHVRFPKKCIKFFTTLEKNLLASLDIAFRLAKKR